MQTAETLALQRFRDAYRAAFTDYASGIDEALDQAYELGRAALRAQLSVLDVAEVHHELLLEKLGRARPQSKVVLEAAAPFLRETLSVFDLTQRSVADAHEAVQLEQQHARQLRRLADAAVAFNSTLAVETMLALVTEQAKDIIGANRAEALTVIDGTWEPEGPTNGQRAGRSGWLEAPLTGRDGRDLGLICVSEKFDGDFTDKDHAILVQLAQMASVAIENAQLFEREHLIAETLQRSLLPGQLPAVKGVKLAARYLPAGSDVGGDWYDAVVLPGGRLALAVGDVTGRGLQAAAVMGQLRMALRAYAVLDRPPHEVLDSLDQLLQGLSDAYMATALYLVIDPAGPSVRFVNAGHPPPLVVHPDGSTSFLEGGLCPPLGVTSEPHHVDAEVALENGSMLLLYTDGLVEERGESLDEGLGRLADSVRSMRPTGVDSVCERVLRRMLLAEKNDDVALLVARLD